MWNEEENIEQNVEFIGAIARRMVTCKFLFISSDKFGAIK